METGGRPAQSSADASPFVCFGLSSLEPLTPYNAKKNFPGAQTLKADQWINE